jgi:flagellar assembly protein FliH
MSSRLFRNGTEVDARPMTWRRAAGPADAFHRSAPPQGGNGMVGNGWNAAQVHAEVEQQIEARIAAAREQGRAEAEAAAEQRVSERLTPALAAFQKITGDLAGQGHRLRGEAERDTVKLAVAIARRILNREIALDPEVVLGLVKAAFAKVEARETHRLRVSPADAALLDQHRQSLHLPPALEILADGSLPHGSAIFETARGDLDASIDTQLAEIERGLADIVRTRLR